MIEAIIAFVFGLLIGSFLNVCVHRWPRGRSVVRPRSHCVRCRKMIAWYDNIPVVSYLVLGGKCRHCGRRISLRYPVVELITGVLFFYFVLYLGLTVAALKMCVFSAMLVGLLFSDLEKRILPDEFTLGGVVIGVIFSAFVMIPDHTAQMLLWLFGFTVTGRCSRLPSHCWGRRCRPLCCGAAAGCTSKSATAKGWGSGTSNWWPWPALFWVWKARC